MPNLDISLITDGGVCPHCSRQNIHQSIEYVDGCEYWERWKCPKCETTYIINFKTIRTPISIEIENEF